MNDVKNLLAVTFVVITAGSAIYTIKTYMQPGMKIAINLAELKELDDETEEPFIPTTKLAKLTTPATTVASTITTTIPTTTPTIGTNATTTIAFETTDTFRTTFGNISSTNAYTEELSISLETDSEVVNLNEDNQREIEGPPLNALDLSATQRQSKPQSGLKKIIRDLTEKDCDSKKSIIDANVKNISKTP